MDRNSLVFTLPTAPAARAAASGPASCAPRGAAPLPAPLQYILPSNVYVQFSLITIIANTSFPGTFMYITIIAYTSFSGTFMYTVQSSLLTPCL